MFENVHGLPTEVVRIGFPRTITYPAVLETYDVASCIGFVARHQSKQMTVGHFLTVITPAYGDLITSLQSNYDIAEYTFLLTGGARSLELPNNKPDTEREEALQQLFIRGVDRSQIIVDWNLADSAKHINANNETGLVICREVSAYSEIVTKTYQL